jgi:hypothetical protein
VLGTLAAVGVFFYYDVAFWYSFDSGPVLKVAAAILAGLCVSSGLLFIHPRSQQSYLTLESIFFWVCFALALVNLLWIAPVLLFL